MIMWRQLKVREGRRHIGRKAQWFKVLEKEILADEKSREVVEEYRGKRGFQVQEIESKISQDKRKKEWVLIKGKENKESEFGRIIRKEKKLVEVEIWEEDYENSQEVHDQQEVLIQQEIYKESCNLKKSSQKQRIALKDVYNISSFI